MNGPVAEVEARGASAAELRQRNQRAILAMLLAAILYGISDAAMKHVAGVIPPGQSVCLRSIGVVTVIMAAAAWSGLLGAVTAVPWRLMTLRGIFDAGNSLLFQTALARMSLPDAMAILQVSPLAMTAVSGSMLGARVGWRRWAAVAAGFAGAMLVIKPGTTAFNVFGLLVVLSALSGTGRDLTTRYFDRALPPLVVLLVSQALVGVLAFLYGVLETWVAPDARAAGFLLIGAVFFAGGHLATIHAVRDSEWSVVAPFRYAGIVWAIVLGLVIWGDMPDALSSAGIAILVAAGLYTLHRERVTTAATPTGMGKGGQ
jgi:S-adenosylmethionine uptake transporter